MDSNCDYRLTSLGPIVEVLVRCQCYADGWTLWYRHRHFAGLFEDCAALEFEKLSTNELVDSLCALSCSWGPLSTPLGG